MFSSASTSHRCSLCYTLLLIPSNSTHSTLRYSSLSKRHGRRCSTSTIERLISSSSKVQHLWDQNDHEMMKNLLICDRCHQSIEQLDQIRNNIDQLHQERQILLKKIEHSLSKRALIIQARQQQSKGFRFPLFNPHRNSLMEHEDDDETTEEGEEKPRTIKPSNGHDHVLPSVVTNTPLVGAKRRKCTITQKIHLDHKPIESPVSMVNPMKSSHKYRMEPGEKSSPSYLINKFVSNSNGHDSKNGSFDATCKSFSSSLPPPFLDPKTGALIAIVSNSYSSLLASHPQPRLSSSSISPSLNHSMDEHDVTPIKPPTHPKKFPCALCGRDFSNKSNLNRHHSIVHVAIRNFECSRCPKKFKLRQGLKTHMQRCHGVNTDEPTFVLQKNHLHNYHPPSFIAQANK